MRVFVGLLTLEVATASLLVATALTGTRDLLLAHVCLSDTAASLFLAMLMVRRPPAGQYDKKEKVKELENMPRVPASSFSPSLPSPLPSSNNK